MESFVVHVASENMFRQICSVFGNEGSMTQNASHATFQGLMTSSLVLKQNEINKATYARPSAVARFAREKGKIPAWDFRGLC